MGTVRYGCWVRFNDPLLSGKTPVESTKSVEGRLVVLSQWIDWAFSSICVLLGLLSKSTLICLLLDLFTNNKFIDLELHKTICHYGIVTTWCIAVLLHLYTPIPLQS